MKPENSRQYYLPPAVEGAENHAPAAVHSAPPTFIHPVNKRERMLQQTTYILVSLAALMYIGQVALGGMASLFRRGPASYEAVSVEPPKAAAATAPPKPNSQTIYNALPGR
jgi:hypothetical protein